jgi:hypothetical protein
MTYRCTGQAWVLDIALDQGGFDALHPEAKGTLQQLGHEPTDFDRVSTSSSPARCFRRPGLRSRPRSRSSPITMTSGYIVRRVRICTCEHP